MDKGHVLHSSLNIFSDCIADVQIPDVLLQVLNVVKWLTQAIRSSESELSACCPCFVRPNRLGMLAFHEQGKPAKALEPKKLNWEATSSLRGSNMMFNKPRLCGMGT